MVAPNRPVLEVVLSTVDDLEIRPYTGGVVAMVGDGTPGHPDWPHIGVALMRPRTRGRITVVSADPRVPPHIAHRYDCDPQDIASLQRGSELVRTLSSYLDRGGSYEATAASLIVHRNTLKYRLQRIRQITGLNLSDPETCFNLQLATRAWRTLQALRRS